MNTEELLNQARLVAQLPSGELLVPNGEPRPGVAICPGPDTWGRCSLVLEGRDRLCAGASWLQRYPGSPTSWRFTMMLTDPEVTDSATCPAAVLDPLGVRHLGTASAQVGRDRQ